MSDLMLPSWQILLPGIPISSSRGALGWSTVTLIQAGEHNLLADTGSYGDRALLLAALHGAGLVPEDIHALFLTHFHYDHILNFDLFANAVIHLSAAEADYVSKGGYQLANDPFVPAALLPLLAERIRPFSGEVELLDGVKTVPLPGHTPGMTGLLLEQEGVLVAGDAIKNGHEFAGGTPPPVFGDRDEALQSYRRSVETARVIIPGHDAPFRLQHESGIEYLESYSLEIVLADRPGQEAETLHLPRR